MIMPIILDTNFFKSAFRWKLSDSFFYDLGFEVVDTKVVEIEMSNANTPESEKNVYSKFKGSKQIAYFGFSNNKISLGFSNKFDKRNNAGFLMRKREGYFIGRNSSINDNIIISLAKRHNAIFISGDFKACNAACNEHVLFIFATDEECKKNTDHFEFVARDMETLSRILKSIRTQQDKL